MGPNRPIIQPGTGQPSPMRGLQTRRSSRYSTAVIAYLADGFFTQVGPRRLRAEVVDGAIDAAAALHQSKVPAALLEAVLLRLRTLTLLLARSPQHGAPGRERPSLDQHERAALRHHLTETTDGHVGLQAFVLDCLEHVGDLTGMQGLCLHIMHVAHLVRLLQMAGSQASLRPAARSHMADEARPAQTTWSVPR